MGEACWRIDELAQRAGLTVDTIRYYAREGLLAPPTKQGRQPTGLGLIEHAASVAAIPWFAIGGIDTTNVAEVAATGARRIVVVRAIRDAQDPEAAARSLYRALDD